MYAHTSTPMRSRNTCVINRCQDEGPLQSPCCNTVLTYVPSGDEKSVLGTSSGTTRICSYASVMSMTETYLCVATDSLMRSWLGSGVESIMVLALRLRASITVRSLSSALILGIDRRGTAFLPCASFHQPASTYCCVFSRSWGNNAAEHRGGLDEYCASGLMSGIEWLTARRGGSSGGGGPKTQANFLIHFWRRGSSSRSSFSYSDRASSVEGVGSGGAWCSSGLGDKASPATCQSVEITLRWTLVSLLRISKSSSRVMALMTVFPNRIVRVL